MEKLAVGPTVNPRAVSLNKPIASNVRAVAEAKGEAALRAVHHATARSSVQYEQQLTYVAVHCREARWRRASAFAQNASLPSFAIAIFSEPHMTWTAPLANGVVSQ